MSRLSRRKFLERGGQAATVFAVSAPAVGAAAFMAGKEGEPAAGNEQLEEQARRQSAMLYDSTLCIGCRLCELACNEKNQLGRTMDEVFQRAPAEDSRALAPDVFTYVTFHQVEADPTTAAFGKVQCMHCIEPACASSCPISALEKTPEGPVIWHGDLCFGCRYCMMACPFLVPRFEWESRNPRIRKCDMCYDKVLRGEAPACVAACPSGALKWGPREELLALAHERIRQNPRTYVHHVYGEAEAGGTCFLHLAARPFDQLGYRRNLPMRSYRDYTRPAMAAIPYVLSGLSIVLGALAGLFNRRKAVAAGDQGAKQ